MVLIRADANEKIGIGHIMRCLSIARAFIYKGIDVTFITADHKSDKLLSGLNHICLESEWADMETELEEFIRTIKSVKPSLLLVDSYYVTENYFEQLSQYVRIAYMDDLNLKKWPLDYLINYNIYGKTLDYSWYYSSKTKLLLGTQYAPLRDEFCDLTPRVMKETVSDVLVSAGGSDPMGITERIISEVCPQWRNVRFHFVIGALNPRVEMLRCFEKENVILHINEKNMSELMQMCDVAISASGATLYELCAVGIPTITYVLADNQIMATEQFEKQGIMFSAGDCRSDDKFINRVKEKLHFLMNNSIVRREITNKMRLCVDGDGAKRIVETLLEI